MNNDQCSRCKWVNKIDRNHWFCPFSQCIEYTFRAKEEVMFPEKTCMTCRKNKKCQRRNVVDGCELYSPGGDSFAVRRCYICGSTYCIEEHHAPGGPNRKRSDREGLTFDLCHKCHRTGKLSAHNSAETANKLKEKSQEVYEVAYGEGSFLRDFGRNYR